MRILIDTNIWISAAFWRRGNPRRLVDKLGELKPPPVVLMDAWLYGELLETFEYIRQRYRLPKKEIKLELDRIRKRTTWVTVTSAVTGSRDVTDNPMLSLTKDGGADYLITGDQDLAVLKRFGKTRIIRAAKFIEKNFPT